MSGYEPAFLQSKNRLRALAPDAIASASLCRFDVHTGCFSVTSLGHAIAVSYPEGLVTFAGSGERLPLDWALILLNYLSSARVKALSGKWVSYGDLPQGRVFYSNIKRQVYKPFCAFLSTCDKDKLRPALAALGFSESSLKADIAVQGSFAPRVPVVIQFWDGEDDLPATCQMLFDRTIDEQMHIEDIAALHSVIRNVVMNS